MLDLNPDCNAKISVLFNEDGLEITLYDKDSRECVAEITLSKEQTCRALSREAHTPCNAKYGRLDLIGKKMILDQITFPMPEHDWKNREDVASLEAEKLCPEGWIPDLYFGSKNNFFFDKSGKEYVRTTIRKWE